VALDGSYQTYTVNFVVLEKMVALDKSLAAWDAKASERQAHMVKGAAAAVGGDCLVKIAFELELLGKGQNLEGVRARYVALQNTFEGLKLAMESSTLLSGDQSTRMD
jgi:HPt (histidine-containing phosphotransfer) domain-containing protein